MENVNYGIACDVRSCRYNHGGNNCTLKSIHVGCDCDSQNCTCCESFEESD